MTQERKNYIKLTVANLDINEGYLARLNLGPGIYIGDALVEVRENLVSLYCINSSASEVELTKPPVTLDEFEMVKFKNQTLKETSKNQEDDKIGRLVDILNISDLNIDERKNLLYTISKFSDQFYLPGDKLGCTNAIKHRIVLTDDVPTYKKGYRYPPIHKEIIIKDTEELLKNKSISAFDFPYNSPVWVIPKKADYEGNKKWRVVIDYRALNEKTVGDAYPLPNIIDILDQLGGARYFSVLDLAKGFHQIEIAPGDRHKTVFSTPFGHYEFHRMPFGLKNAPATFQRLMDKVLTVYLGPIITQDGVNQTQRNYRLLRSFRSPRIVKM